MNPRYNSVPFFFVMEWLETPKEWTGQGLFRAVLVPDGVYLSDDNKTTKVAYISRHAVFLSGIKYRLSYMCVDPYYTQHNILLSAYPRTLVGST